MKFYVVLILFSLGVGKISSPFNFVDHEQLTEQVLFQSLTPALLTDFSDQEWGSLFLVFEKLEAILSFRVFYEHLILATAPMPQINLCLLRDRGPPRRHS